MDSSVRRAITARRYVGARRRFLQLESLEDRAVLAGNITAVASGGYLQLIGDAGNNQIEVTRVGTSGVQITSLDGTTRINGSSTAKTFGNINNGVTAALGNGDDVLELSGSTADLFRVYGSTSINTGEGNDIVRFTNYSTWGSLTLVTGGGDDQIFSELDSASPGITVGGLRVAGAAVINTGAGNDSVSLRDSTFQSNFVLDSSLNNDTVDIRSSAFQRIAHILDSSGTDSLNNTGNTFRYAPYIYGFETRTSTVGPTAGNDTATAAEGGTATVSVLTNDAVAGSTLNPTTVQVVQNPQRGSVVVNSDGTITYTNNGTEGATDSFTYTVRDSQGNISNAATVNVTVTPVNDAPVAIDNTFTLNEGATSTLNLGGNDTDAENRLNLGSIVIVSQPTNGTVTVGSNGNVSYVSNGAEVTSDLFTYTIADQDGSVSSPATVNLTITPVNDAPTIDAISNVGTSEDTATSAIAVNVNDAETAAGDLTVTAISSNTTLVPNGGIAIGGSGSARTLTITPAANQSGTSTITVTARDANNLATTRTFVVTVNSVNDAPTITAVADTSTNEDSATSPISFTIGDTDSPLTGLTVTSQSSDQAVVASNGVAITGSGATRSVVVTPVANANGSSTVTLNVSDGTTTTSETFVLTVNPVNDLPTVSTIADTSAAAGATINPIPITISDIETSASSLTLSATSSNPSLVANNGITFTGSGASRNVVVTPVANATGTTTITVRTSDANGGFVDEGFVLTVNAAPTISAVADQALNEDGNTGALTFTVGDTETAAGSLSVSATSSDTSLIPNSSIVFGGSGANRTVMVTPAANRSGSSTVTVTVTDGNGLTATEQFAVNVSEVNDLPTLSSIANVNANEDVTIAPFTFTIGDVETAVGSLGITASSDNPDLIADGGISITGTGATRTVTLTQVPNASGTANITVQVSDGNGGTATRTFATNITAANDAPQSGTVATQTVLEGSAVLIDLGAAASDVDSSLNLASGITITQQPQRGSVTLNGDGTVTYTHNDSETTSDSFRYTIADAQGATSAQGTVNVTVTPVNDAPLAANDIASLNFPANSSTAVSVTGNVLTNDSDVDTTTGLNVTSLTSGNVGESIALTYGTLTIGANGAFNFTVDPEALDQILAGTDLQELIGYEVSDGQDSSLSLLTINLRVV